MPRVCQINYIKIRSHKPQMVGKHEGICGVHSKANTVTGPSKSLKAVLFSCSYRKQNGYIERNCEVQWEWTSHPHKIQPTITRISIAQQPEEKKGSANQSQRIIKNREKNLKIKAVLTRKLSSPSLPSMKTHTISSFKNKSARSHLQLSSLSFLSSHGMNGHHRTVIAVKVIKFEF